MAPRKLPKATWLEIFLLIPHFGKVIVSVLVQLVSSIASGKSGDVVAKDVFCTGLRTHLNGVNIAQELLLHRPSTDAEYLKYAKRNKLAPTTTMINPRLPLHWIGPKDADKVLLYFHGGGYFFGASPGHLLWLAQLQRDISKPGCTFSIALLSYTLASEGTWPQQLRDSSDALRYLVEVEKRRPSDICIGGDSAGGHMSLTLISHLLHPQPKVKPLKLSEPLMTAVLISPFIRLDLSQDSWTRNRQTDYITQEVAHRWTDFFLDGEPKDRHNTPGLTDTEWYRGVDRVVKDVLMWGGGAECFIDSIKIFYKTLKPMLPGTELIIKEDAFHVEFVVEPILFVKKKAEGTKAIESWLLQRLECS